MTHWIDTPEALAAKLAGWTGQALVALDTEFIRERTFFPQLALVQLAIPGEILLVDPTVPGMDAALRPLLQDPAVTKLMHSASEDLQALQRGCGALPAPLFDTQVAAAMAGLGAGLGYQKLVEQVTGEVLDKGETRSDWLRRPLSDSQLHYAAEDVRHLHALHAFLVPTLEARGRLAWLQADADRQQPPRQRGGQGAGGRPQAGQAERGVDPDEGDRGATGLAGRHPVREGCPAARSHPGGADLSRTSRQRSVTGASVQPGPSAASLAPGATG